MNRDNPRDPIVRRIVLPSGKTIEVLRLDDERALGDDLAAMLEPAPGPVAPMAEVAEEAPGHDAATVDEPHLCGRCASTLVYPVAWAAAGTERWSVELRCPNCERTTSALLELDVAEHFDEELEWGAETLMSDLARQRLARLTEANMLDALERLGAALRADAIVPSDF
jgi:hypothetical protein